MTDKQNPSPGTDDAGDDVTPVKPEPNGGMTAMPCPICRSTACPGCLGG